MFFPEDERSRLDRLDLTIKGQAAKVFRCGQTPRQLLFSPALKMIRPMDLIDLRTIIEKLPTEELLDSRLQSKIVSRVLEAYSAHPAEGYRLWFVVGDICEVLVALSMRIEGLARPHNVPYSQLSDVFGMGSRFHSEWKDVFETERRSIETPYGRENEVAFLKEINGSALLHTVRDVVSEAVAKKSAAKFMRFMIIKHAGPPARATVPHPLTAVDLLG